jgi:hypothetical protein
VAVYSIMHQVYASQSAKLLDAIEIGFRIDIYIYLFAEVSIKING